jgi:hypothetical protein
LASEGFFYFVVGFLMWFKPVMMAAGAFGGLRVNPAMTRTGGFSFGFVWWVALPSGSGAC